MKRTLIWIICLFSAGMILIGCNSSDDSSVSSGSDSGTETSFNFTMTSFKSQETASSSAGAQADFTVDQIMTGQLTATPSGGGTAQVFDWSIYFDETTWDVQSNKTIILAPGTYDFSLLITKGSQEYAGTAAGVAISDGTFDVPMTIRPVIGDTVTDVTLVASLADFKFQYDPAELSAASLTNPQMGIIVDGGTEEVFTINPSTGISDNYVNLPEGSHTVQLKLYEASLQVGRSITAQESIIITAGLDLAMDLVALHGETTFALTEAGGDANFQFNIPAEVVDEAGGLSNLQVLFAMVGPNNPLEETVLSLSLDASGDYEASATLTNKQFDDVDISLTFTDTSVPELLGSCTMESILDTTQRTLNCDVTLRRRAIVGGSLLATLGVNVMNDLGEPVAGAVLLERGELLGITGSGAFGTPGYVKIYHVAGEVPVYAETTEMSGEVTLDLAPLSVTNETIVLTEQRVTGVWKMDRPGDQFSYFVLFPNHTLIYAEDGDLPEPEDGVEVGLYAFSQYNTVFVSNLSYDDNTYPGGWSGIGSVGIPMFATVDLSPDRETFTLTAFDPFVGSPVSWNKVNFNNATDYVGIWTRGLDAPRFGYMVLFPDLTFLYAENGENPDPEDGLEVGTYSINTGSGEITINLTYDDNTYPGGGSGLGTIGTPTVTSIELSNGGNTLTIAGVVEFTRAFPY